MLDFDKKLYLKLHELIKIAEKPQSFFTCETENEDNNKLFRTFQKNISPKIVLRY